VDGEPYARPEAVTLLRAVRRDGPGPVAEVRGVDPLNVTGILTPGDRVAPRVGPRVPMG